MPTDTLPTWPLWTAAALLVASAGAFVPESAGRLVTPVLPVRKDVKRETLFLAQYGQFVCTVLAAWLVFLFEDGGRRLRLAVVPLLALTLASLATWGVKRVAGRVRPGKGREGHVAGAFLGPAWKSGGWRESFPSSHSAGAFALSGVMSVVYPQALVAWVVLAGVTAALRWVLDAHWLSDVLAGSAVGLVAGWVAVALIVS